MLSRASELLVARFNVAMMTMRDHTIAVALQNWDALATHNEPDAATFTNLVVPAVRGAQVAAVSASDAYFAHLVGLELGKAPAPKGIDPYRAATDARNANPNDVYRRPFVTVWSELKAGKPLDDALATGRARLAATVAADVMLAHRQAATQWFANDTHVSAFQRFTGGKCCELCAAATATYARHDLMPIHPNCSCTVQPIIRGVHTPPVVVGEVTNDGQPVDQLPTVRVVDHGEMGPLLVNAADHYSEAA